ncbi:MAG TPA: cyclic nucleotide-binding domain-containing protein [Bauldia sp.]|nr:cyclic nucleotide-binding domain-containing protein [Bauldia sp.]
MESVLSHLFVGDNLVHLAAAIYLAGFLFRDQIMLRGLLIAGDVVYTAYYVFAPAEPLWGGAFWSIVFILVNTVMITRIIADRAHFGLSEDELLLFRKLDTMTPGEFRRFVRLAGWHKASDQTILTRENQQLENLYFVIDGGITIEKAGRATPIDAGVFIGEVSFLLTQPASATVTLSPEARYVAWDAGALRRLLIRAPSLRIAFNAALNRDMAAKVARA